MTWCWWTKATSSRPSYAAGSQKTLVEGAGAAGWLHLEYSERFKGKKVGLVLSGGDIDPCSRHHRARHGAGRAAGAHSRQRRIFPARWPKWQAVAAGANINEVHHQRAFTTLAASNP